MSFVGQVVFPKHGECISKEVVQMVCEFSKQAEKYVVGKEEKKDCKLEGTFQAVSILYSSYLDGAVLNL